jgi:hypothetical protein
LVAGEAFFRGDFDAPDSWIAIAKGMGTDRAPYLCLIKYHQLKNPKKERKKWTQKEDETLISVVQKIGCKNWAQVALLLEGKTGTKNITRLFISRSRPNPSPARAVSSPIPLHVFSTAVSQQMG